MCGWDILKRRDNPIPMGRPEFETSSNMKTVGLMIWITRDPCSMDRNFCVLRSILEIIKRGVYGIALVKKRCYWPGGVHGDVINKYFSTGQISAVECLSAEWDETEFLFIYEVT